MKDIRKLLREGKPIGSEPSSIRIVCQSAYVEASYKRTCVMHVRTHMFYIFNFCLGSSLALRTSRVSEGSLKKPGRIFVARF